MQEIVNPFVEFIRNLLNPFNLGQYAEVVAVIPFLLLLYVIYLIVMRSIKISFRRVGVPDEAISGIRLMIRLLFFGVGLSTLLTATELISGTAVITGGAIFGTAIGLAFARALSNMVSGFYMLVARPFRVGDYVRIGDIEGIVNEISLNYTRLILPDMNKQLVPNSKVVESEVTNFRVRVDELMYERGVEQEKDDQGSRFRSALGGLKNLAKGSEVYRYTFDVQVQKDYSFKKVLEYFNDVCDKHAENFLEKPEIMYWNNQSLAVIYRIAFIVNKPMEILTVGADLQAEIAQFHEALR
ncbi:MAG: mechanosensitive ion channel domain-containing protein [Promethearchaeota archaeon]